MISQIIYSPIKVYKLSEGGEDIDVWKFDELVELVQKYKDSHQAKKDNTTTGNPLQEEDKQSEENKSASSDTQKNKNIQSKQPKLPSKESKEIQKIKISPQLSMNNPNIKIAISRY